MRLAVRPQAPTSCTRWSHKLAGADMPMRFSAMGTLGGVKFDVTSRIAGPLPLTFSWLVNDTTLVTLVRMR